MKKGLDVMLVRFIPFIGFIYFFVALKEAWNGNGALAEEHLFGATFLYIVPLFAISICNKKYHCIWNRAMYATLSLVPIINYIDFKFNIFQEAEQQLYVLSFLWAATAITTGHLAINSFFIKRIRKAWSLTN